MTIRLTDTKRRRLAMLALFLSSTLVYLNSINGEFISDDRFQIAANDWIRDFKFLPNILFSSVWDFPGGEGDSNYYRPVKYILYSFCYKLSGLSPWGYHLMKVVLHATNTVLVFLVAQSLLGGQRGDGYVEGDGREVFIASFAGALFFGLHPINTEAVSWIAAVPEVSFTLFALLALLFYLKGRYLLTSLAFLLSAFSKETGMMLPFILVAYDLSVGREPIRPLYSWVRRYAAIVAAGVLFIIMRVYSLGGEFLALGAESSVSEVELPGHLLYLNLPALFFKYIGKLSWPTDITFFNFNLFNQVRSVSEPRALFCIIFFIAFLVLLFFLYKRSRPLLFALLWMVIMIFPPFFLAWKGGSAVYESRYLYGAVPGFTIFVATIMVAVARGHTGRINAFKVLWAVVLIVALLGAAYTVKRNFDWKNEFTLWRDAAEKNPHSRAARLSYGVELAELGRLDEAMAEFVAAKRIDPNSSGVYNNIGIIHAKRGRLVEAARNFELAVMLDANNAEAKDNLEKALRILDGRGLE